MFTLSPATILRPEPQGALLFQQETAETALLDMAGLEALYRLCTPKPRQELPLSLTGYLLDRKFVLPGESDGSAQRIEECIEQAKTIVAPQRSLIAPETIHFSVTGRCDQACAGCFYSARLGSEVEAQDAPFALFEKVVLAAEKARVFQIALGGGEPLLHPRIVDMVRLARSHHVVPNLTTNGNRLDRELVAALKEAGLGQVQISLNGASEEANASTRPNFQPSLRALEVCQQVGLRFGINFLLTRSNVNELPAVLELGQRLGAASVNLLRPKPPTTEGDWLERESLDAEGYRVLQKTLRQIRVSSPKFHGQHSKPETSNWKFATRITLDASLTFLLTDCLPAQLYRRGVWGCCAARKFVTILPDGAVLPCSHVRWTDVGDGDFLRAWQRSQVFARFRTQEEEIQGRCGACAYLELCKGCRAVVMAFGGDFEASDPHCPR